MRVGGKRRPFWDAFEDVGGGRGCFGMPMRVWEEEEVVLGCI